MLDLAWAIRDYSSICHISPNLGWTPWRCFPGVERWRVSSRYLSTEVLKMINSMGYNASTKESYILSNTVQTIGKSWWFAVALPSIRNKIPLHYQKNILSVTKRKMVLNNSSTNLLHSVSSLHDAQLVRTWREIPLQSKTFPYQLPEPFCTFPSFPSVPMQLHQPLSPSFPRIWKSKKKTRICRTCDLRNPSSPQYQLGRWAYKLRTPSKRKVIHYTAVTSKKNMKKPSIFASFANSDGLLSSLTSSINLCKTQQFLAAFLVLVDGNTTGIAKPFT